MEAEVKRRKRRVVLVALAACLVVGRHRRNPSLVQRAKQSDEHVQGGQHHRSDDEAG